MEKTITIDARMINASGIGTYLKNLLPIITERLTDYKFNVLGKICELEQFEFLKKNNIHFINFKSPIYSIQEQIKLIKLIPEITNLYWAPHYNMPIFYKGKLLVSIMDLGHLALSEINHQLSKKLYATFMFNQVKKKSDATIYISEFSKSEFNRIIGKPKTPQFVTLLGVDQSWLNVPDSEPIGSKPFLLYVGNVKPHKNLSTLIDAFGKIINKIPHDLIIIGRITGFITPDVSLNKKAIKFSNRIVFTGEVGDEILKQYVSQADIFVFPSIYEGFGLPPLEAMAAGTPVVASSTASIPEVCGDAALYFDPYDTYDIAKKIKQLICDVTLQENLRRRGIKRAKQFSWEKCARETIAVIEEVLHQ